MAILAVVAYHARMSAVGGGFVGVDVFFVISGFLITDHLTKELEGERGIRFGAFYARRARRLLPSAVLVIVVTLAVSAVVLPPLQVTGVAKDGVASGFYVANYRFAALATNYLTASGPVSPFLHYWSLGVEEQFYLVWPALLLVTSLVWRPARRMSRRAAFLGLVLVWASSFGLCVWLTHVNEPWAFFSLPTRAWELATGGLVALVLPWLRRVPPGIAAAAGWAGLAAVVWSSVSFSAAVPFPGTAALVPVVGAAAIIAAGSVAPVASHAAVVAGAGPALLLDRRPLRFVGRVSYTWYLWHWPALVLAPSLVGHPLTVGDDVLVSLASLVLAIVTSATIERPAQHASWMAKRPRRSLAMAGVLSCTALASALVTVDALPSLTGHGRAQASKLAVRRGDTRPRDAPQARASPAVTTAEQLTAEVQAAVARSVNVQDVPANITPPLASASGDEASPFYDGCFNGFTDASVHPCNYGDVASPRTVVLFGDSHALMWFPAIENLANQQGWHLIAQAKATCPPVQVPVYSPDLGEWYTGCDQWRAGVLARIAAVHPAVVILGFSREYGIANDHVVVDGPAWMHGLASMITTIRASGAQVVVLGDVPYPPGLVPNCLSAHLTDATACNIPKAPPAFNQPGVAQERAVVAGAGGSYIDTEPWFCTTTTCAVMVENMIVYRDDNHITKTYASWLTPVIGADLEVATHGVF